MEKAAYLIIIYAMYSLLRYIKFTVLKYYKYNQQRELKHCGIRFSIISYLYVVLEEYTK